MVSINSKSRLHTLNYFYSNLRILGILTWIAVTQSQLLNPGYTCFFARSLGDCSNSETKWYFDFQRLTCSTFSFSGCNGNFNNFRSEAECLNACSGFKLPRRLRLNPTMGATVYAARMDPGTTADTQVGKEIKLLCRPSMDDDNLEIEYCKWTKPPLPMEVFEDENMVGENSNRSIVFPNSRGDTMGNYSYHGQGMVEGDCGITIHNVQQDDVGYWSCLLVKRQKDSHGVVAFKASIQVAVFEAEDDDDSMTKLGIGLGIFVFAVIGLICIFLFIHARKNDKWCFEKSGNENRAKGESGSHPEEMMPAIKSAA